jgi:hypothetical protein
MVSLSFLLAVLFAVGVPLAAPAGAVAPTATTTSHYESSTNSHVLYAQGQAAGQARSQGLVILDFGRPAVSGSVPGTMDFNGQFASLASIGAATVSYVRGYFAAAPSYLDLDVAIGTNNSCGTGQPCGGVTCGCVGEPPSYATWGAQLAAEVEAVQGQTNVVKRQSGYTDAVKIFAGDDAEPAFDPGFQNTDALQSGYAAAVGGYTPAMIDYGSADAGFWSESQLLTIADGFRPNLAVPEIYSAADASRWATLVSYAKAHGRPLTIFGVLTTSPAGNSPGAAYNSLLGALRPITGQNWFRWPSNISHS